MSELKKELTGKRFQIEEKIFTVYAVSDSGVFAYKSDVMETNEKGEILNSCYFDYEQVERNLITAGRPTIGVTKKVSITLPDAIWKKIEDEKGNMAMSAYLREFILNGLEGKEKQL